MTLILILTRHAKSSWDDPAQADFDRPLNGRGRRAARALGEWLASRGHAPQAAVLSPARRTRETLEGMRAKLPAGMEMREEPRLYAASEDTMLEVLRAQGGATPLLMIGHNPGIGALAARLTAAPPRHAEFARYPTGATLVLHFEAGDWAEVGPGAGDVLDFVVPRDLNED